MQIRVFVLSLILTLFLAACSENTPQTSNDQRHELKIQYDKEYTESEKALIDRVTNDLANKICPNVFTDPKLIEGVKVSIANASSYQKESQAWTKQIEIDAKLAFDTEAFGSAAGNYCRFGVGKSGAYVKNKCASDACKRIETPEKGVLVTYLPAELDYIEEN